jgi:hypothetical protein
MRVIALPEVDEYLQNLVTILYLREYFGFEESAQRYVDDLYNDIQMTLSIRLHKPVPKYFDKYGKDMKYAAFKKSKHTTWYVFFKTYRENGETVYLVRYVANNHVIAQCL